MPWPGRAGADHAALADRHAADHRHIAAEPAVRPDHDRLAILVVVIRPVSRTLRSWNRIGCIGGSSSSSTAARPAWSPRGSALNRVHKSPARSRIAESSGSAGFRGNRSWLLLDARLAERGTPASCMRTILPYEGYCTVVPLAGGYGRVSPPYRHMRPVVAGAGQRQVVAQWCNGKPCPGRPARRGGERTRGVGPCTGLPSVWQDVP